MRACDEPHRRAEAEGRRGPDEVQAGNRRFAGAVQHRVPAERGDTRPKLVPAGRPAGRGQRGSRCRRSRDRPRGSIGPDRQAASARHFRSARLLARESCPASRSRLRRGPSATRPREAPARSAPSRPARPAAAGGRRSGNSTAGTSTLRRACCSGCRTSGVSGLRPRAPDRGVRAPHDQLHLAPGFMQQGSRLQRRRAGTHDGYAATPELRRTGGDRRCARQARMAGPTARAG